ncbi:hypothetical protein J6590_079079 [Homalodisca vitripennis]|nr:hypothetical protein J6590_079079 [Homalodisca vitripennis]
MLKAEATHRSNNTDLISNQFLVTKTGATIPVTSNVTDVSNDVISCIELSPAAALPIASQWIR